MKREKTKFMLSATIVLPLLALSFLLVSCAPAPAEEAVEEVTEETTPAVEEAAPAEETTPAEAKTKITWWTWWAPPTEEWGKQYRGAMQEALPDIEVEWTIFPFPDYQNALKTALQGGEAPDVFSMAGGGPWSVYVPILEPLEPYFVKSWGENWKDRFKDSDLKEVLKVDPEGKTFYEMPMANDVGGIVWYNTKIFEKYGLEVPKSYVDLKKIGDVLNQNGIIPIAWGAKDKWPNTDWYITIASQTGGDAFWKADRGEAKYTDPGLVKALEVMVQMQKDKLFSEGAWGTTQYMDAENLFFEGKAAMMANGTWDAWTVTVWPNVMDDFRGFLFPPLEEGGQPSLPWFSASMTFAMYKDSKVKDAAWKFIEWHGTPEGATWWATDYAGQGHGPALRELQMTPIDHEGWMEFMDWMFSLRPQAQPREMRYPEVREALETAIEAASTQGMDPAQAMQMVQDAYNKAAKK